jgi:hypothetical protein
MMEIWMVVGCIRIDTLLEDINTQKINIEKYSKINNLKINSMITFGVGKDFQNKILDLINTF